MLFCQKVNDSDDIKNVFREWCKLYYTSVLKYCTYILEHKEDAEDCVQEVFTECYEVLLSGIEIKSPHAYILKMAKNICSQKLRTKEKQNKEIRSFLENNQLYGQLSLEEQFSNDVIGGKVEQIAQNIIESLSTSEKSLYYDYFIKRMTAKQIACSMYESPSSVAKKIKNLKKQIIKLVKKAVDAEGGGQK